MAQNIVTEKNGARVYCSLDIETSGFDPLTNEVLEVGFVFFTLSGKGAKITEEWTQVFNPAKAVAPGILGLTGISQKELDQAPKFSEYQKFLQDKLGQAVIVGHNIAFDTKFLEGFGIKFSGTVIDTLDLVQFILPTHHSYNLENLMHTFGISHKEAHRALADSNATLKLLEKLLQIYCGFPEKLKLEIQKFVKPYNFAWKDFLFLKLPPLNFQEFSEKQPLKREANEAEVKFKFQSKAIYNFSLDQDYPVVLARALTSTKFSTLLVVPKSQQVMGLYKQGLIKEAVFLPEAQFDGAKFAAFCKKKDLSEEEIKFLLKILVWRATNWQTETILDLNLSFFGGQFRSVISGGSVKNKLTAKVAACDQSVFFYLSENKLYKNCRVIICGLNEFESAVTANIGTKTSWNYINYLLKSFYNPEIGSGQEKFKEPVVAGLVAGDLFFGLVGALLQIDPPSFQYFKISPQTEYDEKYQKIRAASENFIGKLLEVNKSLSSKEVERFAGNLQEFFLSQENRVKWIELAENRCAFLSMPIDITSLVKGVLSNFSEVSFADSLCPDVLPEFFAVRLGLNGFVLKPVADIKVKQGAGEKVGSKQYKQGDLFSGIKKAFSKTNSTINFHYLDKTADAESLMKLIKSDKTLPSGILFASPVMLKEFYEKYYQELKSRTSVLAQLNSGGSNKIFRNFGINPKSLLLATDKFVLRHLAGQSAVEAVGKLRVKTLVICRLPFEQFTHPYQEAVSKSLPSAFMDYALPRALFNFHSLIRFFFTPELKDVYVIDAKLSKDYAGVFKDYYKFIPGAKEARD